MTIIDDRKAALTERVEDFGGPLNELPVLAQFLAQVMHESGRAALCPGNLEPTKAQRGYEGRRTWQHAARRRQAVHGRDVIQVWPG